MEMNNSNEQKMDGLDKSNSTLNASEDSRESGAKTKSKPSFFTNLQLSDIENKILKGSHDVGDFLERIGERVQLVGETIYKIGNAIEHLNDRMNEQSRRNLPMVQPGEKGKVHNAAQTSNQSGTQSGAQQSAGSNEAPVDFH